jgi:hypothetical protein
MWIDIHAADGQSRFVDLDEPPSEENRYFQVDEEMVDGVRMYVEHVRSLIGPDTILSVEERLDMTHIDEQIFGTGDATVLDLASRHLHVVDFKYGKGVAVDADSNPQLMLYAAGAARRHHNHQIAKLTVHIVQPRAYHFKGPIRTFDLDLIELMEFEGEVEAAAKVTKQPDAPLKAGEWCRFCLAQAVCPERRRKAYEDAIAEFSEDGEITLMPPAEMSMEQLAKVASNADALGDYVKAVQKYLHDLAMGGTKIPGMKLVPKRAVRKWRDQAEAEEFLQVLGVSRNEMFEEPKFKSPAKLESCFPGKNKVERQQAMADLVEAKSSGLNLVPESDPRPGVEVGAASEFEAVDMG